MFRSRQHCRHLVGAISCALTMVATLLMGAREATGAVAVFFNRATSPVRFTLHDTAGSATQQRRMSLAPGEVVSVPLAASTVVAWNLLEKPAHQQVVPYSIYAFTPAAQGVGLSRVAIEMPAAPATPVTQPARQAITVKLLVDQHEAAARGAWENRLRRRVAAASEILQRHGGLPLRVVAVGTWQSNDALTDLEMQARDFERRVDPGEAQLAIGFSSRYITPRGRTHMGGTRGPLSRHILLREWLGRVDEAEAVELLVHELGHYLGAAHSAEPTSVMRPMLVDTKARSRRFRVQFDPLNALAISIIAEQLPESGELKFHDLDAATRGRLMAVYRELYKLSPDDPAVQNLLKRLELIRRIRGD